MRSLAKITLCYLLLFVLLDNATHACTNFCLDTPAGPIFGCNLDLFFPGDGLVFINQRGIAKEGYDASSTGQKAKWISKYGSITFNLAGREFVFGGMNEAGLVVSTMELMVSKLPRPDERPPLSIGTWAQYVLDTCADIEQVIQVNSKVRIEDSAPPVHFLISDADGNCVAIEWLDGQFVCHSGDSLPIKAMSNMPYARALAAYERGGPRWWWSNPGQSAERFAGAAVRSETYSAIRDTNAVSYAFETLTNVVAAPHTKWSIVYDIANRQVWFGSAQSPTAKHLSLNAFDLSCDTPLLMLDINVALEGNVEQFFKPYGHETNLSVFRALCARYKIEISEKEAINIVRHFEGFDCAQ